VRPHEGGGSPELGWGGELRGPRVGFYRHERERMVAWTRAAGEGTTRVAKTGGAASLLSLARLAVAPAVPAVGKCHCMEVS
jgi:hypothetical protein